MSNFEGNIKSLNFQNSKIFGVVSDHFGKVLDFGVVSSISGKFRFWKILGKIFLKNFKINTFKYLWLSLIQKQYMKLICKFQKLIAKTYGTGKTYQSYISTHFSRVPQFTTNQLSRRTVLRRSKLVGNIYYCTSHDRNSFTLLL